MLPRSMKAAQASQPQNIKATTWINLAGISMYLFQVSVAVGILTHSDPSYHMFSPVTYLQVPAFALHLELVDHCRPPTFAEHRSSDQKTHLGAGTPASWRPPQNSPQSTTGTRSSPASSELKQATRWNRERSPTTVQRRHFGSRNSAHIWPRPCYIDGEDRSSTPCPGRL